MRWPTLNGKRIAIREWGMTAVVWIVGILAEEYGLDVSSVDWVAAIEPRVPIPMPQGARIRYMKPVARRPRTCSNQARWTAR